MKKEVDVRGRETHRSLPKECVVRKRKIGVGGGGPRYRRKKPQSVEGQRAKRKDFGENAGFLDKRMMDGGRGKGGKSAQDQNRARRQWG